MNIGDNLRVYRTKKNLSQQNVADFVGVERKTYERWENGEASIKSEHIPKLADVFQVEIPDLYWRKTGDIIINQHNPDYKDNSTNNSIVLLITNKEDVAQILSIVKKRVEGQQGEL